MNIQIKHYGRVRSGEPIYHIPDLFQQQMLELEGKDFVMTIKEQHIRPSMSQYGYYRGAILVACHKSEMFVSFNSKDNIHDEYFAPKFLSYTKLVTLPDKMPYEITIVRSLADLTKVEMTEFMERILADCVENNIEIPPSELFYNKYYQK